MVRHTAGIGFLIVCLAVDTAFAAEAPSPSLTDAEHAELLALLDSAQDDSMAHLTGLTDERWRIVRHTKQTGG